MTVTESRSIADQFMVRKDIAFLNHGSFGACPRPVFETFQGWQRELEQQPVEFLGRRVKGLLGEARGVLAEFIGTAPDNVVFVPNVTHGMNAIARSMKLEAGDEVLATDHEYGAVDRTWRYYCERAGATYINQPICLPVTTAFDFAEQLWAGVTPRTRVICLSHITSATALIFPLAEICSRAQAAGIITVVDGAHAPGQVDLDLDALGADFYTGNCHKWLCAPKGSGFLYARPARQGLLEPFVVSWGYQAAQPGPSLFIDHYEWTGTSDPAAYLSVPAAIAFQRDHDWPQVRAACHALAREARERIIELTDLPPIAPDSEEWWNQMCTILLPVAGTTGLKQRLWDEFQVEVPIGSWQGQPTIRVSVQAYNTREDIDRLLEGLAAVLRDQ